MAAVLIPPVAWWHSVEFFWHSDEPSTSSSVPDIPDGQVIETLFENAWWIDGYLVLNALVDEPLSTLVEDVEGKGQGVLHETGSLVAVQFPPQSNK